MVVTARAQTKNNLYEHGVERGLGCSPKLADSYRLLFYPKDKAPDPSGLSTYKSLYYKDSFAVVVSANGVISNRASSEG